MKQRGFFDENDRLKELSLLGDPLEKLNMVIDWESFRHSLNKIFKKKQGDLVEDLPMIMSLCSKF